MKAAIIIGLIFLGLAIFEIWRDGSKRKPAIALSNP